MIFWGILCKFSKRNNRKRWIEIRHIMTSMQKHSKKNFCFRLCQENISKPMKINKIGCEVGNTRRTAKRSPPSPALTPVRGAAFKLNGDESTV